LAQLRARLDAVKRVKPRNEFQGRARAELGAIKHDVAELQTVVRSRQSISPFASAIANSL
jgi:hypothetical protein